MATEFATYVGWKEISGQSIPLDKLRLFLSQLPKQQVIFACSLLNTALGTWEGSVNVDEHDQMLGLMFSPQYAQKLSRFARYGNPKRYVFHRQQVLFLIREAAVHAKENLPDMETGFGGRLGLCCLIANDLLQHPTVTHSDIPDYVRLLPEMVIINDYTYRENILGKIARTKFMLEHIGCEPELRGRKEFVDVPALFEGRVGLSLGDYSTFGIGVLCKYLSFRSQLQFSNPGAFYLGRNYFQIADAKKSALDAFLGDVSVRLQDLTTPCKNAKHNNDFNALRDRPLVEIQEGAFAPTDVGFLADKLESGVFWRVHNECLSSRKERDNLHTFWGHLFQAYVSRLLQDVTNPASLNRLISSPMFDKSGEACDAIILCPESRAIFMEFKSSMLTAPAKYSGEPDQLLSELQEKFVGRPEKPKGIYQLANAITKFARKASPERIEGMPAANMIFPVLIAKDYALSSPLVNRYLNDEFKKLVYRKNLRVVVGPLFVLTIYELEEISPHLIDCALSEILEGKYQQDKTLSLPFLGSKNRVLEGRAPRTNLLLRRKCDEMFDNAWVTFFGKTFRELQVKRDAEGSVELTRPEPDLPRNGGQIGRAHV